MTKNKRNIEPALLTQRELAAAIGCSMGTIRNLQKEGLPYVSMSRSISGTSSRPRFNLAKVMKWLERRNANARRKEMTV